MSNWPFNGEEVGLWFRSQSDFVTEAATGTEADWSKMVVDFDLPQLADNTIDLPDAVGQAGAAGQALPGSRDGITFKVMGPVRSQAEGWNSTDAIALSPEVELIADFLGAYATRNYQAAAADTGADANTVPIASGSFADGHFVGFGANATAVDVLGFIKTAAGLELLEDAGSVAASGDHAYGAVTIYPTTDQMTPRTFRWLGGTAWQDFRLIGCIADSLTLTWANGQPLQFEMTFTATDYDWASNGDDLVPAPTYNVLPAFIGANGGRLTVDLVANSDGNADSTDVYCDVADLTINITRNASRKSCGTSRQGVSNVLLSAPNITITCSVPVDSTEISSNDTIWGARHEAQTKFSLCAYVGNTAGRMAALCIPQARLHKRPTLAKVGGDVVGHQLEMKPAQYTGDTSTTAPADTPFRFAVA